MMSAMQCSAFAVAFALCIVSVARCPMRIVAVDSRQAGVSQSSFQTSVRTKYISLMIQILMIQIQNTDFRGRDTKVFGCEFAKQSAITM